MGILKIYGLFTFLEKFCITKPFINETIYLSRDQLEST